MRFIYSKSGILFFLVFLIAFSLDSTEVLSADFHDFDKYQYKLTYEEVEERIAQYLEKDKEIRKYYQLTPDALYVGDLEQAGTDYVLQLAKQGSFKPKPSDIPGELKGVRIAVDPGHFGGSYDRLEKRYISISEELSENGVPVNISEGNLTYLTALALKDLLEAEGAEVYLTRSQIGEGAISSSFYEWMDEHSDLYREGVSLSRLFLRYYNQQDLIARSQAINEFAPDLTIVIHYNVHVPEKTTAADDIVPSKANYNMIFVPGAFCARELDRQSERYEFLRLIVTEDVKESVSLSKSVLAHFTDRLDVPAISDDEMLFLDDVCLKQEIGIYARNLALLRRVHGPVCYGESLIQNNEKEMYRLSTNDSEINKEPCPKRIWDVAYGYFEGIKEYITKKGTD